jgi:hypothetical protein
VASVEGRVVMRIDVVNTAKYNDNAGLGVWFCWCGSKHIMVQFFAWEFSLSWGGGR